MRAVAPVYGTDRSTLVEPLYAAEVEREEDQRLVNRLDPRHVILRLFQMVIASDQPCGATA